eukprot:TRINITY_DN27788_c0_g1_i1.p1 TRINITY_DN27788_c0_g1~~TRINITY_DN27788_c0_g1_i1.p1  ORF type:complete len:711 (+),score=230.13 TRINITY_DN27788_c0_g1_i1:47-2179(+)
MPLTKDVVTRDAPTQVDCPNYVIMCEELKDVLKLADMLGKSDKVFMYMPEVDDATTMSMVEGAVRSGEWYVLDRHAGHLLRDIAQNIFPKASYDCHPQFRLFYVDSWETYQTLPTMFRMACIKMQSPIHQEMECRKLVHAVETDNLHKIIDHRACAALLTHNDQIAMLEKCMSCEAMITLLVDIDIEAENDDGVRAIDVALDKRHVEAVKKACSLGAVSYMIDLPKLNQPDTQDLLHAVVHSDKVPFDELAAVQYAATTNNAEVLREIFDARLDSTFAFTDYPLAAVMVKGYENVTQMMVDRMERVGLHPFRSAQFALYFMLEILGTEEDDIPASAFAFCESFASTVLADGSPPYPIPTPFLSRASDHPTLVNQLLSLADATHDPLGMMGWYVDKLPSHPYAYDCLQAFIIATSPIGNERADLIKAMILRGHDAIKLLTAAFANVKPNVFLRTEDPEDPSRYVEKTPVMFCTAYPSYPEALQVVLEGGSDVDYKNDVGLTPLQQVVIDLASDPMKYMHRLTEYAEVVRLLLAYGAVWETEAVPMFTTSLFRYCARHDLAPICYELLQRFPREDHRTLFLSCSENIRAGLVESFHRKAPEEWFFHPPAGYTSLPADVGVLARIFSYLPQRAVGFMGRTSLPFYCLTLLDQFWGDARPPSAICSRRQCYLHTIADRPVNRWVQCHDEPGYYCLYTGRRVAALPEDATLITAG